MQIKVTNQSISEILVDALIISVFEDESVLTEENKSIDIAVGGLISDLLGRDKDVGKFCAVNVIYASIANSAKKVFLLGMGKRSELNTDRLRKVAGTAIRTAARQKVKTVATLLLIDDYPGIDYLAVSQAWAEGALLGTYRFQYYKSAKQDEVNLEMLYIIEPANENLAAIEFGAAAGRTIAEAVNLARDLVNHPANYLTPVKMAWYASEIAEKYNLELNVFAKYQIENMKMDALLAVSKGSNEPPRFIVLQHHGCPEDERLFAFVGKGITFDSGGISLKPSEGMQEMKDDMAGAATVLAAIQAIAALGLPVNIIAVIPCTENMPSGHACRPGDVINSLAGKTIEVISTDAEGRLILADAIAYAKNAGATHIVDLATLTGACVVALGDVTSGIMGNDKEWKQQIIAAAGEVGEKVWELPLFEEYKEQLKSSIADLKNSGGRKAGAITAGLFLAEFAGDTPWVHVDIAGTVSSDKDSGYNVKGATGVGVRTLIQLAKKMVRV
ncbi:MAG: pepA [Firmicutes bacterium]|nr:pepA [Bacillota bacterium]